MRERLSRGERRSIRNEKAEMARSVKDTEEQTFRRDPEFAMDYLNVHCFRRRMTGEERALLSRWYNIRRTYMQDDSKDREKHFDDARQQFDHSVDEEKWTTEFGNAVRTITNWVR